MKARTVEVLIELQTTRPVGDLKQQIREAFGEEVLEIRANVIRHQKPKPRAKKS